MFHFDGFSRLPELDVSRQRVFVRADLDCPANAAGEILDDSKIHAAAATLRHLLAAEATLIVGAHRGPLSGVVDAAWSLESCGARLAELLNAEVFLPEESSGPLLRKLVAEQRPGSLVLLENLAFDAGEISGDEGYARTLGEGIDLFVGDCLAGPPQLASIAHLPRACRDRTLGIRAESELVAANRLLRIPQTARVLMLGGQFSEQAELLNWALRPGQTVVFGGPIANTLLTAQGANLKSTQVEARDLSEARAWLSRAKRSDVNVVLPRDARVVGKTVRDGETFRDIGDLAADERVVDVGPETLAEAARQLSAARGVLVSGEFGAQSAYPEGSRALLELVALTSAFSIVVGGMNVPTPKQLAPSAVERLGFVSTAGAAFTAILCGKRNAGLESLRSAG